MIFLREEGLARSLAFASILMRLQAFLQRCGREPPAAEWVSAEQRLESAAAPSAYTAEETWSSATKGRRGRKLSALQKQLSLSLCLRLTRLAMPILFSFRTQLLSQLLLLLVVPPAPLRHQQLK